MSNNIMDKSSNDIDIQIRRCIELATQLDGRWTNNAKHRADTQFFAQLGRKVKTQRGIPMFGVDKDRKYPLIIMQVVKPEPKPEPRTYGGCSRRTEPVKRVAQTPTEKAENMMSFTAWMSSSEVNRKKIQDGARHAFIRKMYAELLTDFKVCELEGWDIFEFPQMLHNALAVCFPKEPKQLTLNFDIK